MKWNAQYQQAPTGEEGALIKRDWWKMWTKDDPPRCEFIIQSWDTAFTKNTRSDYSACTTWGVFHMNEDENDINIEVNTTQQQGENTVANTNNTNKEYKTNNIKTNNTDTDKAFREEMYEYMDEVFAKKEEEDKDFRKDMNEYMDYEFNKDTIKNHDYQTALELERKLKQLNLL
jgi:phage terminase large subunit-like protein